MKNWTTKVTIFAAILYGYSAAQANAGLFVEPSVTYEVNSAAKVNWPAPLTSSTGSAIGLGIGARLGIHVADIFFVGGDLRYSQPKFKDSNSSYNADSTSLNYGVVAGIQTPVVGLRVWGGYILGGQLDPKTSNSVDLKFKDASGYRVGAGLYVAVISVNLEYQSLKYSKTDAEAIGPFAPGAFNNASLTNDSYVLSVSFPIAL